MELSIAVYASRIYPCYFNSQKHGWLYRIIVPSSDAYKKEYQWWGVLELLRRVVILLFAVVLPDILVSWSISLLYELRHT